MEFSKSQEKTIIRSINKLNELKPICDVKFNEYQSVKFKGGLAIWIGFFVMLGVLSGNSEVKDAIGTLGVGVSPFLLIGGIIYIFDARKKYHKAISDCIEHEKPLLDLGLGYSPVSSYSTEPRLIVIDTREEIDIKLLRDIENI
ncbi:hypothetical protein RJY19_004730 [Vibrio alginolyticus]|nr:hypothetical protein [Vibrio alginolyticus]